MPEVNMPVRCGPGLLRRVVAGIFHRPAPEFAALVRRRGLLGQGRLPGSLGPSLQDLDSRVVVIEHLALSRLPSQFFKHRLGTLGLVRHDVPLGRGGQGNPQVALAASLRG